MDLFSTVPFIVLMLQSGIVKGFTGFFACFPIQEKLCDLNVLNFYPKVNELFKNFLKVNLLK